MPLIDGRTLPEASRIDADVVIIGGGLAGLAIAHQFVGTTTRVCVLEGGDLEPSAQGQAIYGGKAVMSAPGNPDQDMGEYLAQARVRALGGSGFAWGGKVAPLDEVDFAERSWIPHSGWPLDRARLKPFYDRACDLLKVPRFPIDDALPEGEARRPLTGRGAVRSLPRLYSPVSGGSNRALFDAYRKSPAESANIAVHLNLTVSAIRLGPQGRVDRLELRCPDGRRHTAHGATYILATGGIENARLLLASTADRPEGVGNQHGLVGRFFQGHVTYSTEPKDRRGPSGVALTAQGDLTLYDNGPRDRAHCVLALEAKAQAAAYAGNATLTLTFGDAAPDAPTAAWWQAVGKVAAKLAGGGPARAAGAYLMSEHTPNPLSRVTLADEEDSLGQKRARLEWRYDETAWRSLEASTTGLARHFGAEDVGRLCWPLGAGDLLDVASPSRHHMGTTRMDADPKKGVVDADCRVHGVENLFIAGSSVFPTSGLANPTLTIVALAMRLSDHVKTLQGAGS